jgi:hypothetical protein
MNVKKIKHGYYQIWASFVLGKLSLLGNFHFGKLPLGNFRLGKFRLGNFRSAIKSFRLESMIETQDTSG